MERGRRRTAGWVAAAIVAGNFGFPEARAAKPDLKRLASELRLTAGGARAWLTTLGIDKSSEPTEHLLAVDREGRIIERRDGSQQHVSLGLSLDTLLLTEAAEVTLIHNHPGSAGLSADDLSHLAKPGVAAVAAIGHDGSIYLAAAGPAYDRVQFEPVQYANARQVVDNELRQACASATISTALSDTHRAHVVSLALAKAGVIEYEGMLAGDRRASFERARTTLGRVSLAASSRVPRNPTVLADNRKRDR